MIPKSCDTMVALAGVTRHGQTVFAKNSDRPAQECQPLELHPRRSHPDGAVTRCQFVSLPEVATTWRHVGSRPWWCWGYEHGYNEHQVVIGNEGLGSRLPTAREPRLIGMEILRLGLERARTAAEAVDIVTDLVSRYGQGEFVNAAGVGTYDNGYIVADPREAYVIETAGHHWAVKRVSGALGISNVYSLEDGDLRLSPEAESDATERGWWEKGKPFSFADAYTASSRAEGSGAMRRRRSCTALQQRFGSVDVRTMMAILGDHSDSKTPEEPWQTEINPGSGICIHASPLGVGGNTAASLVADLCADGSRLPVYWCSLYSPCLGLFLPTFIEGQLPEALGRGGERARDDSPWWGFHLLSRLARTRGEAGIRLVRQTWGSLQDQLFESAYATAAEGRRLIDAGRAEDADALLTGYMADSTAAMLDELAALQRQLSSGPSTRLVPEYSPRLRTLAGCRLDQLSRAEFADFWVEMARQVSAAGLPSLVRLAEDIAIPLVREGITLAVDTFGVDLIEDLLKTRQAKVLYPRERTLRQMTMEAVCSILSGDDPHIVHHKVGTLHLDAPAPLVGAELVTAGLQELQERLRAAPFVEMTFEALAQFWVGTAFFTTCEGPAQVASLADLADHSFLRRGLQLVANGTQPAEAHAILKGQLEAELEELTVLQGMLVAGVSALQSRPDPEEMRRVLSELIQLRAPAAGRDENPAPETVSHQN